MAIDTDLLVESSLCLADLLESGASGATLRVRGRRRALAGWLRADGSEERVAGVPLAMGLEAPRKRIGVAGGVTIE